MNLNSLQCRSSACLPQHHGDFFKIKYNIRKTSDQDFCLIRCPPSNKILNNSVCDGIIRKINISIQTFLWYIGPRFSRWYNWLWFRVASMIGHGVSGPIFGVLEIFLKPNQWSPCVLLTRNQISSWQNIYISHEVLR